MKTLRHLIEAAALVVVLVVFRLLPLDAASWLGGFLAQHIGPFLKAHKIAKQNLAMIFPEKSDVERDIILRGMWDNLGRNAAELPRLPGKSLLGRLTLHGEHHLPSPAAPVIFISGHMGNWELAYPIAHQRNIPTTLIYRHANNPFADKIIVALRATQSISQLPKGPAGAVKLVRALKNRHSLALLIDQKMNDGIPVPFFGRDAMTAPAVAQFALRYDMPILAARVVRTRGAHFDWFLEPLPYEKTGDTEKDVLAIMTAINALLEKWIREYPAQWFWVHKRWPN
jgi:KDO2-lipid IV(A) lauroyltransferase